MNPAPLPPEEIERIELLYAGWQAAREIPEMTAARLVLDSHLRSAWPSIKAEIEAGRAGAERVRALEAEIAILRGAKEAAVHPDLAFRLGWGKGHASALRQAAQPDGRHTFAAEPYDPTQPRAVIASQPAQPADGAQAPDMVERHEKMLADWVEAHPVFGPAHRAYQASKAAAPAQVGAQPAGRVEAEQAVIDAAMEQYANYSRSVNGRLLLACQALDVATLHHRATPPTAGAGDGD